MFSHLQQISLPWACSSLSPLTHANFQYSQYAVVVSCCVFFIYFSQWWKYFASCKLPPTGLFRPFSTSRRRPSVCSPFMCLHLFTVIKSQNKHTKPWRSVCMAFLRLALPVLQAASTSHLLQRLGSVAASWCRSSVHLFAWGLAQVWRMLRGARASPCLAAESQSLPEVFFDSS